MTWLKLNTSYELPTVAPWSCSDFLEFSSIAIFSQASTCEAATMSRKRIWRVQSKWEAITDEQMWPLIRWEWSTQCHFIRKSVKERWRWGRVEREGEVDRTGWRVELICMARANYMSKLGQGGGSGREGGSCLVYKHISHPSNIKNLIFYRFVVDSSRMTSCRLLWGFLS